MELAFRARLPGQLISNSTSSTHHRLGRRSRPSEHYHKYLGLPRRSPGSAAPLRADLRVSAPPTRIHAKPSTVTPTPSDTPFLNPRHSPGLPLLYRPSSGAIPPTRIRIPQYGPDKALHTRSGHAPAGRPSGRQPRRLRIRQPRRHRIGPRGIHHNQTRQSPAPAAPLRIKRRPCLPTRIRTTI